MRKKERRVVRLDPNREHYTWREIVELLPHSTSEHTLTQGELWNSFQIEDDDCVYYVIATNPETSIGQDLTPITTVIHRQAEDELESLNDNGDYIDFPFRYRHKNGVLK